MTPSPTRQAELQALMEAGLQPFVIYRDKRIPVIDLALEALGVQSGDPITALEHNLLTDIMWTLNALETFHPEIFR